MASPTDPDEELLALAATASDELAFAIERDEAGIDRASYFAYASNADQPELADPTRLDLAPLFIAAKIRARAATCPSTHWKMALAKTTSSIPGCR